MTKEGSRVKLPIWLPTTKSLKSPRFTYVQVTCHIALESSWWWLQLCLDLISIIGLHTKLWASKVAGVLILGISRLRLGGHGTKWHLGASPMAKNIEYYKGESGGFPQFGSWWVLWVCVCMWLVRAPNVFQLCTNQLVLFV